ncbi:MAG: hypothetical protein AAGA96_05275 [Verrucomicrobiota bacterium]
MNIKVSLTLLTLAAVIVFHADSIEASAGDQYASYWNCSNGNTYGLVANGNHRALYLPTLYSPIFFSGMKKGNIYVGTVYCGNQPVAVSGPISNHSTRVTLYASDGRYWVLDFSHR